MDISFKINSKDVALNVDPTARLSDVLRNDLGLTATKIGCNAGDCGACTVMIDGEVACSCLTPAAQIDGLHVETAEGMADDENLNALQQSFLHHGAAQCGICTPGMLISAQSLLRKTEFPTRQQVEDALGGVLCRCTGYQKIIEAVLATKDFKSVPDLPDAGKSIGMRIQHLDGIPKVDGSLKYGADLIPDDALGVHIIRSPHHFARFEIGDKDHFIEEHEGILAVYDASDIPGRNCHGVIPPFSDQPVFCEKIARYRGDAIAMIVGEREVIQYFNDEGFPVTWEVLPHALRPEEASVDRIVLLHDHRSDNILITGLVERGNPDEVLSDSDHKIFVESSTPFVEHSYIEPEAGYCVRHGNRLEIFGCTQAAQMDLDSLAEIMGVERSAIRVKPSACGGAFGSKLDLSFQPYVALAAWHTGRPATICYSRSETMRATTKRHPSEIKLAASCSDEGLLSGFDFHGVFNTGAYASWGPTVANRVPVHASGPYFIPNYRARAIAVHTNTPPAGAFRGFGVPQSAVAQEMAFDRLADKVSMDRLEFRIKNALQNGQPTVTGQIFKKGVGISNCLEALRPAWQSANKRADAFNKLSNGSGLRKGVGLGSCWYGCGNTSLPNPSTVRIGIRKTGEVVLHQGAMDIGQGANTVISQIAADALGVPVHSLMLIDGDTDLTPDCGKTSASRQTYVTGSAAKLAGMSLRKTLLRHGNVSDDAIINITGDRIDIEDHGATASIHLDTIKPNDYGYVFMAEETYDPPTEPLDEKGQGIPYAVYGYGGATD